MPTYTNKELREWLFSQKLFHELYDNWKINNYEINLVPSVDRIDDYFFYTMDNIQLMTWEENNKKGYSDRRNGKNNKCNKVVRQYDLNDNFVAEYHSTMEAYRQTGISRGNISECCMGNRKTAGGCKWKYKIYA